MSIGDFYSENRKAIDARKAHLARVGIPSPEAPLPRDVMGSQADVLRMPTLQERPLLDATHEPMAPAKASPTYKPARSPLLAGKGPSEE